MKRFKIHFPVPYNSYNVKDIYDDNFDINVITEDGRIFFAILFTSKNVERLMSATKTAYFWARDMIIVKDLSKFTYSTIKSFEDIQDMTHHNI